MLRLFYESRLLYQTGAPVAKFLSRQLDSAAMNLYVAASMFATERLMLQRPLAGTPEQHLDWLTAQMRERIPRNKRPSANQMRRVTHAWLKAGGAEPMIRVPNIILLDDIALRQAADGSGSGRAAQARLLRSDRPIMLTANNIRETALPKFQAFVNADARIAAVGLLFSTVSTLFARDSMQEADVFADEEAAGRFYASSAGLIGGVLNTAETGIQRAVAVNAISVAKQENALARAERFGRFGRFLGAGVAFVFAVYDVTHAVEELIKGNYGLSALYLASAAGGFALGYIAIAAGIFSLLGMALVLVMLGIGFLIGLLTDSKTQQWLSHCFYGSADRFSTIEESQQELGDIFRGECE